LKEHQKLAAASVLKEVESCVELCSRVVHYWVATVVGLWVVRAALPSFRGGFETFDWVTESFESLVVALKGWSGMLACSNYL